MLHDATVTWNPEGIEGESGVDVGCKESLGGYLKVRFRPVKMFDRGGGGWYGHFQAKKLGNPGYFSSPPNKESEMKRKEWRRVKKASNNREYQKAIDCLNNILACKIDDQERVIVLVNIAQCNKKLNKIEEAVSFFDRAIDIENKTNAFFALMHKAAFLYETGKPKESLDIYKIVKAYPNLTAEDKEAININIDIIRKGSSI